MKTLLLTSSDNFAFSAPLFSRLLPVTTVEMILTGATATAYEDQGNLSGEPTAQG